MSQEQEIDLIINSTQEGIVAIDCDERITLFNRGAELIIGRKPQEVLGRPVQQVIQDSALPEVLRTGESQLNQQLNYRNINIVTSRIPLRDGKGRVVGAFAVFRDISDAIATAEEITNLREIRIMWRAIFESTQDAISVVDENGIQVSVNTAYTRMTGLSEEDVIGRPCTIDISSGDSIHLQVLRERRAIRNMRMKVGPYSREVLVDAAPIIVDRQVKGSVAVIRDISEILHLTSELSHARTMLRKLQAKYTFDDLVGSEACFLAAVQKAKIAATTPATILLIGESGTGKELFAHAIHNASDRRERDFVRINCASLAENVLESELFGYEAGAFTGALKGGKAGLFEAADGGTIFLDEIGLMSLSIQAKLLRVLQENEVRRVGGTAAIAIDTRVIAASNLNLAEAVKQNRFREDLYYRLNVMPISIPALRARQKDIPLLAAHILTHINQEYGRAVSGITPEVMEKMLRHSWPGNVREMENVLKRAVIHMSFDETVVSSPHMPELTASGSRLSNAIPQPVAENNGLTDDYSLRRMLDTAESAHLRRTLAAVQGSRTRAASLLGISLRTLQYKLKYHAIS